MDNRLHELGVNARTLIYHDHADEHTTVERMPVRHALQIHTEDVVVLVNPTGNEIRKLHDVGYIFWCGAGATIAIRFHKLGKVVKIHHR